MPALTHNIAPALTRRLIRLGKCGSGNRPCNQQNALDYRRRARRNCVFSAQAACTDSHPRPKVMRRRRPPRSPSIQAGRSTPPPITMRRRWKRSLSPTAKILATGARDHDGRRSPAPRRTASSILAAQRCIRALPMRTSHLLGIGMRELTLNLEGTLRRSPTLVARRCERAVAGADEGA